MAKETVSLMVKAALADEWPEDNQCLKTFMFDRCQSEEELINLFGLYIGLIKLNEKFNQSDLIKAIEGDYLTTYIIEIHHGMESYYLNWFKDNLYRFS